MRERKMVVLGFYIKLLAHSFVLLGFLCLAFLSSRHRTDQVVEIEGKNDSFYVLLAQSASLLYTRPLKTCASKHSLRHGQNCYDSFCDTNYYHTYHSTTSNLHSPLLVLLILFVVLLLFVPPLSI